MKDVLLRSAVKLNKERKRKKLWQRIVSAMSAVVVFITTYALILPAITMETEAACGVQSHEHLEECYTAFPVYAYRCGQDPGTVVLHTHNQFCVDGTGQLICQLPELAEHTHTDACYALGRALICDLPECDPHTHHENCFTLLESGCDQPQTEAHTHDDTCAVTEQVLTCEVPEAEGHAHGEECKSITRDLSCTAHIHEDGCYTAAENLICAEAEHTHSEGCFTQSQNLICTEAESETHTHGESCWETVAEQACTQAEHTHSEGCYETVQTLTCTEADHTHEDGCYTHTETITCELPETEGHAHGEGCYTTETRPCGKPEGEGHTHSEECGYTAETVQTCELEETQGHSHTDECYVEEPHLICEKQELVSHIHTPDCLNLDGNVACGQEPLAAHDHTAECLEDTGETYPVLTCGLEEHLHVDACYPLEEPTDSVASPYLCGIGDHTHGRGCSDEDGNVICTIPEHTHEAACLVADLDLTADVEQAHQWEATINELEFTGHWPTDTLAIARTQLDYQESVRNVILRGGVLNGYTRYGAWYGDAYADWDALFVAFCLHYAGVEDVPVNPDSHAWLTLLEAAGLARSPGEYTPKAGDLIFLDHDQKPDMPMEIEVVIDRVALVAELIPAAADTPAQIKVIEGDSENMVRYVTYEMTDPAIISYGELPEGRKACGLEVHQHTDGCCDGTGSIVCGLEEHIHDEACGTGTDLPVAELPLTCMAGEHTHSDGCYDESGSPVCGLEEHTHSGDCYGPAELTFTYEDDNVYLTVDVVSTTPVPEGVRMVVTRLGSGDQTFESYADYALENGRGELVGLLGYQIHFFVAGQEVQLADARITAQVTVKPVDTSGTEEQNSAVAPLSTTGRSEETPVTDDSSQVVTVTVLQEGGETVTEGGNTSFEGEMSESTTFTLELGSGRTLAVALNAQAQPNFQVQYYCHLPHFIYDYTGTNSNYSGSLAIIDTSSDGDGDGGSLPSGGSTTTPNTEKGVMYLYLEPWAITDQNKEGTTTSYHVVTQYQEVEIYSPDDRTYYSGMTVPDLNKIQINTHYALDAIWISYDGGATWTTYGTNVEITDDYDVHVDDVSKVAFTNNPDAATNEVILIQEGTIVRFEYTALTGLYSNSVNFFDYDISNGTLQDSSGNSYATFNEAYAATSGSVYMNTYMRGINQDSNYLGSGAKFAFGNANTATGLGDQRLNGNNINKYNGTGNRGGLASFSGCSYGLVAGYDLANDRLIYTSGIAYQALFNDAAYHGVSVEGKTTYSGSTLDFIRVGDTYTLQSVNGGNPNNPITENRLDEFFTPAEGLQTTSKTTIFTNNFWPMDGTTGDDVSGHDMVFGDVDSRNAAQRRYINDSGSSGNLPLSDDHNNHNCYFGMQYAVEFTLDGHYVGPLEYLFYGDDDMWVFLTYPDGTSVQICDIGGVHSSVGSYTNLWDYIVKGEASAGTYTLSFFYTERGASGSSCYMAFTIPHVVSITQNTEEYGSLSVSKEVENETVTDATYTFRLDLVGEGANDLFPYMISGVRTQTTGSIKSGETFTISAGETFTVYNIPVGVEYTLTELFSETLTGAYEVAWKDGTDGSSVSGVIYSDKISGGQTETIVCTNSGVGTLELTKVLSGGDGTEIFYLDVTLTGPDGVGLTGTYGGVAFTDGKAVVEITGGQTVTLTGLPAGTTWTVLEQEAPDYTVAYTVDGTQTDAPGGTVGQGSTVAVVVTNTRQYVLPNTGGMGTNPLTYGGAAILTASAIMYCCINGRKRRKGGDCTE